jgi:hypothetical protein
MISVSDAYDIVRRWNAKECYVVHYARLHDFEEASNRFNFEFDNPTKDVNNNYALLGGGVKGILAKGPELRMEIIPTQLQEASYAIRIIVFKGKKNLLKDDILLHNVDAYRLRRYIRENF